MDTATTNARILQERDFRLLLTAQFAAQAADGLAQAVFADILILEPLTRGTPERIFTLFAITLVPYSAIAPFMGVFVDRWPRRSLLVWTNVVRGSLLLTLPLWAPLIGGNLPLYFATLALLGLGRLFLTTKGAALPALLHEHHLLQGNSLSSGGGMIAALAGGVVGISAAGILDYKVAFVIAGIVYLAGAAISRRISDPLAHPHARLHSWSEHMKRVAIELGEGIRAILARPNARIPLTGIFVLRVIVMFVAIAAILFIKQQFGVGERFGRLSSAAVALGTAGLGAFVGATTAPLVGRRLMNAGLITLGFFVSTAGIVVLGGIVSLWAVAGLTFLGGYGAFVTKVAVDAQVQEALPDEFRGRAFALYDILYNLASVVAAGVMLLLFDVPGRADLVLAGLFGLLLTALMARSMKKAGMELSVTPAYGRRA